MPKGHKFRVPDEAGTVKLMISGIAASCFNKTYMEPLPSVRCGRWEVALPRFFSDHKLSIRMRKEDGASINLLPTKVESLAIKKYYDGVDYVVIGVSPDVRTVAIKDRGNGTVFENHDHRQEDWDRKKPNTSPHDYQWTTDFKVTGVKTNRKTTLLYVYDATFYSCLSHFGGPTIHASQDNTGPVISGQIQHKPDYIVGPILDGEDIWGYSGSGILADIHQPEQGSGVVDVLLDDEVLTTFEQSDKPGGIWIDNIEQDDYVRPPGSVFQWSNNQYLVGDNYLYYEMFEVDAHDIRYHDWERRSIMHHSQGALVRTEAAQPMVPPYVTPRGEISDCFGVRVDLPNLDDFLS